MRLGLAVAVTASTDHRVVDRRRIALVEPGMPPAPIHHEGKPLDDKAIAALVAKVRAPVVRAASAALNELATAVPEPIVSMSLPAWPVDFPEDIAVQRRAPYESRADSVMYRQVLAELAHARGWEVHFYNGKDVEDKAVSVLAERADEVLHGPAGNVGTSVVNRPSHGARRNNPGHLTSPETVVLNSSCPPGGPPTRHSTCR